MWKDCLYDELYGQYECSFFTGRLSVWPASALHFALMNCYWWNIIIAFLGQFLAQLIDSKLNDLSVHRLFVFLAGNGFDVVECNCFFEFKSNFTGGSICCSMIVVVCANIDINCKHCFHALFIIYGKTGIFCQQYYFGSVTYDPIATSTPMVTPHAIPLHLYICM